MLELLVVIGILGILVSIAIGSYTLTQQNARDGRRKTDLELLRQSLELYRADNGSYPASNGWQDAAQLEGILVPDYIDKMPNDPKVGATTTYRYYSTDFSGTVYYGYCIEANLEASVPTNNPCDPEAAYNYTVRHP